MSDSFRSWIILTADNLVHIPEAELRSRKAGEAPAAPAEALPAAPRQLRHKGVAGHVFPGELIGQSKVIPSICNPPSCLSWINLWLQTSKCIHVLFKARSWTAQSQHQIINSTLRYPHRLFIIYISVHFEVCLGVKRRSWFHGFVQNSATQVQCSIMVNIVIFITSCYCCHDGNRRI